MKMEMNERGTWFGPRLGESNSLVLDIIKLVISVGYTSGHVKSTFR